MLVTFATILSSSVKPWITLEGLICGAFARSSHVKQSIHLISQMIEEDVPNHTDTTYSTVFIHVAGVALLAISERPSFHTKVS